MNTQEKLERYSDLQERLDFLTQSLAELKEKAVPSILKEQWGAIKEAIASCQAEIDDEYLPMIDAVTIEATILLDEIKTEVLTAGATAKGSRCMAVWNKGRASWDGAKLDGYAMDHPEILQAKKIGEPTVSIRSVK